MNLPSFEFNLTLAWVWILLGFASGSLMGLNFKFFNIDWAGGYSGLRRRMYRLGHISFFGLALINFMFYFTVEALAAEGQFVNVASLAFIAGTISMPLCCFVMAHFPRLKYMFYIPVVSLLIGGLTFTWEVLK